MAISTRHLLLQILVSLAISPLMCSVAISSSSSNPDLVKTGVLQPTENHGIYKLVDRSRVSAPSVSDPVVRIHCAENDENKGIRHNLRRADIVPDTPASSRIDGQFTNNKTNRQNKRRPEDNRYKSFAAPRTGNQVKWYVDGASYFWAVSVALEQAKESIWILDWWLSPELYLRRPASTNEQYRLDHMLEKAAKRGVKVNIIVYKEVTQVMTLDSSHTKHALEGLHPNIRVFRHPDHLPDQKGIWAEFLESLKGKDTRYTLALIYRLPTAFLRAIFGGSEETIFYWAHHEKLCLVDGRLAFMGGLDLSFGRWDTNEHPLSDLHPGDRSRIIWPGQDYNNARIKDFTEVWAWQNDTLDRQYNARMGWSDVAMSLAGPSVEDLRLHFVQRWNWIVKQKYRGRYDPITYRPIDHNVSRRRWPWPFPRKLTAGRMKCQILRSAGKWSHGLPYMHPEHSIMNAYIDVIANSKHFIYIENQFFITQPSDVMRKPVRNKIGKAIVERIIRASKSPEPFKIIVVIPAIPAFAGDLREDAALGTRAIMEFQYYSIRRGGQSICEVLQAHGIDASKYIRFFNLRNYDRINTAGPAGRSDSVSRAYMNPPVSLHTMPWSGSPQAEIDAFVSEELYVHTKLLIADDRIVLVGSANLNDRSQTGYRDSEIVAYIEDTTPLRSRMAGKAYTANRFAASLRRFVMRKHLGLVPAQDYTNARRSANFMPVTPAQLNEYDFGSREDRLVMDPLGPGFQALWNKTAATNTAAFERVFRPVPADNIRTWKDYEAYNRRFFPASSPRDMHKMFDTARAAGRLVNADRPSTWKWGHVIAEDFRGGVKEVKDVLNRVRGTLVDMPLNFLIEEDIAKWGPTLNPVTEQIYT